MTASTDAPNASAPLDQERSAPTADPQSADASTGAETGPKVTTSGPTCFRWAGGPGVKRVNLALQGGGAHGAFTWGVLDAILENPKIEIESISGTSAGAMNAAVMAAGISYGGREGGRAALETFWREVSREAALSPIQRTFFDVLTANWSLEMNPALAAFDVMSRVVSPYQFNPLNWNPLLDIVSRMVDFEAVQACQCVQLFVSATNVNTGRLHIFTGDKVTPHAVMASACLPWLFQAVEIDGVPYWDGGYMGNPVLSPFFSCCRSRDIVIVQVNPIARAETPRTAREIQDRVNEISFNAPLIRELRHVAFINGCLQRGELGDLDYREVFLHRIGGSELDDFGASTKLNAEWAFLTHLRDIGREAAQNWFAANHESLGEKSTLQLSAMGVQPSPIIGEHAGGAPADR
ncbi:MAG: patatin-like phospholipase family protein [Pseudomonadota bacterium]